MAKRKKSKGRARRRRIGAALNPGSPIVKIGAVAAGYFLGAKFLNPMIDKVTAGKVDDKIVGAGQTGLGALLLLSKKQNIIKTVAGGILAGSGLKRALTAFGVLTPAITPPATTPAVTGYGNVPVVGRINGYGNVPVVGRINGYTPSGSLGAYSLPSGRVMGGVGSDLMN